MIFLRGAVSCLGYSSAFRHIRSDSLPWFERCKAITLVEAWYCQLGSGEIAFPQVLLCIDGALCELKIESKSGDSLGCIATGWERMGSQYQCVWIDVGNHSSLLEGLGAHDAYTATRRRACTSILSCPVAPSEYHHPESLRV